MMFLLGLVMAAGLLTCPAKVPVIFDTDMGPDYDDVGALAVLNRLADLGEAEILAAGASNHLPNAVRLIGLINRSYKREGIPIGALKGKGPGIDTWHKGEKWTEVLPQRYPIDLPLSAEAPDAVAIYRKALAAAEDGSVVMVSVGFFPNLRNLLRSPADAASPLDGKELVRKKVKRLVSMAGKFPSGKETNIIVDPESAREVFEDWPVEILIAGYEVGRHVRTGDRMIRMEIKGNPVVDAYAMSIPQDKEEMGKTSRYEVGGRASYDQTAVLAAVRPGDRYFSTERGNLKVDPDGTNHWEVSAEGRHTRLVEKMPAVELAAEIEDLMMPVVE
ncbi:nucleoside hydrolase [Luteolibacter sp. SL250]|uniref:nucleoside hydrolase n=1 Tax=Luteolibacter sp. SL250 TaxID=2995170 RepID=UPI0022715BF3|nr:nucleoside hydrolase [Luteolibacter sp. SL250]WAC21821.1 nucleoside hydrolase [Luteolibacter sp. SL250]